MYGCIRSHRHCFLGCNSVFINLSFISSPFLQLSVNVFKECLLSWFSNEAWSEGKDPRLAGRLPPLLLGRANVLGGTVLLSVLWWGSPQSCSGNMLCFEWTLLSLQPLPHTWYCLSSEALMMLYTGMRSWRGTRSEERLRAGEMERRDTLSAFCEALPNHCSSSLR